MKKTLILISLSVLILTVFVSCGKNSKPTTDALYTDIPEAYSTTEPEYTAGSEKTSEKFETGKDEYQISYYDENGFATKLEFYRKGKLRYYYEASSVDETGNCIQQKYYTADGELFGVYDNGFFFDENGIQISEDMMQERLEKYQ